MEFYLNKFIIDENVLIPRQETEYFVDLIVRSHRNSVKRVLDVGTGSGVILLSLLWHGVGESGVGVDLSEEALCMAQKNSEVLGLSSRVHFIQSDRLQNVEGMFDLIVSNPPYIKANAHLPLVHPKVNEYEPHLALYLPDEDYDQWFEKFFVAVRSHLRGDFYMEGHELEVERQAKMLERLGFSNVSVMVDLSGTPRFIRGTYKPE